MLLLAVRSLQIVLHRNFYNLFEMAKHKLLIVHGIAFPGHSFSPSLSNCDNDKTFYNLDVDNAVDATCEVYYHKSWDPQWQTRQCKQFFLLESIAMFCS